MINNSKPVACSVIKSKKGKEFFKLWFPYTDDFVTGTPVAVGFVDKDGDYLIADVMEHTFTIALDRFGRIVAIEW